MYVCMYSVLHTCSIIYSINSNKNIELHTFQIHENVNVHTFITRHHLQPTKRRERISEVRK